MKLAINIDHIATIRQARGGAEPDPVIAAGICEIAGAEGIVCHLREDRRHINDRDVAILKERGQAKFNLEMAATDERIAIARKTKPETVTLVPEKRQELTTEGGLNLNSNTKALSEAVKKLKSNGIKVSLFIDPLPEMLDKSVELGADIVEIHTGTYANTFDKEEILKELTKIGAISRLAAEMGLVVTAGHGLNYNNIKPVLNIPEIEEVSIGHAVISRAVFVGLDSAVREMVNILNNYR